MMLMNSPRDALDSSVVGFIKRAHVKSDRIVETFVPSRVQIEDTDFRNQDKLALER